MSEAQNKTTQKTKSQGAPAQKKSGQGKKKPRMRKNRRSRRRDRVKPEFAHRVIDIRRVTRVVAGGRRFSFSAVVVAGNKKGSVGVGVGKASDTALAIEKAQRAAKKNMLRVARTETHSIPHEVEAKYASAKVMIFPAPGKGGLTAGSAVRNVLEFAGIKDVGAKVLSRTKNKINIARAAIKALSRLQGNATKEEGAAKKDTKKSK